jgi:hypothetical protein
MIPTPTRCENELELDLPAESETEGRSRHSRQPGLRQRLFQDSLRAAALPGSGLYSKREGRNAKGWVILAACRTTDKMERSVGKTQLYA